MFSPGVVEHHSRQVFTGLRQVTHGETQGGEEPALRRHTINIIVEEFRPLGWMRRITDHSQYRKYIS